MAHADDDDDLPAGRDGAGTLRFLRTIVSEHGNREEATAAARTLSLSLAPAVQGAPRPDQDQLFVLKPNFKSLKVAGRVKRRRR